MTWSAILKPNDSKLALTLQVNVVVPEPGTALTGKTKSAS